MDNFHGGFPCLCERRGGGSTTFGVTNILSGHKNLRWQTGIWQLMLIRGRIRW
jgi:hypothetical protein